eukprot:5972117-Pyramimonas_sp.AAC.1
MAFSGASWGSLRPCTAPCGPLVGPSCVVEGPSRSPCAPLSIVLESARNAGGYVGHGVLPCRARSAVVTRDRSTPLDFIIRSAMR